jgi:trans-aconitate 2-methyltransferase
VAQCGGEGNVAGFIAAASAVGASGPFAEHLDGWIGPWNFAGAEETAARLARAGFTDVETWLEPYPVKLDDPTDYLRTVCLGFHLERLPEELRDSFVDEVRNRSCEELDYVRLNMTAHRPPSCARSDPPRPAG